MIGPASSSRTALDPWVLTWELTWRLGLVALIAAVIMGLSSPEGGSA